MLRRGIVRTSFSFNFFFAFSVCRDKFVLPLSSVGPEIKLRKRNSSTAPYPENIYTCARKFWPRTNIPIYVHADTKPFESDTSPTPTVISSYLNPYAIHRKRLQSIASCPCTEFALGSVYKRGPVLIEFRRTILHVNTKIIELTRLTGICYFGKLTND